MSTHATGTARRLIGRALISSVAVLWPAGAFAADWNETHVFNPKWSPHAKFHNGQTLVLAVELAGLSLWQLWGPPRRSGSSLRWGTLFAGLYFATQVPALLLPGAALIDPEFADQVPTVGSVRLNQVTASLVGAMPMLLLGYRLASNADADRGRCWERKPHYPGSRPCMHS